MLSSAMDMDMTSGGPKAMPGSSNNGIYDIGEEGDDLLSSSAPGADGVTRNSRLARKAESARQARLRHKQFVTDLQDQAAGLRARIGELEAHCTTGPGSASVALRELKAALSTEQLEQLRGWLVDAQGEDHVLARYEKGAALPPPPAAQPPPAGRSLLHHNGGGGMGDGGMGGGMGPGGGSGVAAAAAGASAPIAIGGGAAHWRGGGAGTSSVSPMESDEDGAFPLSRSWDDQEVARSILNLNSPNGFHPLAAGQNGLPPPTSFSLPTASSMGPPPGSSLFATNGNGSSMFGSVPKS